MSKVLLLVCVWVLCTSKSHAERRNLTEITYRFTNCESTSHDGPRVIQQCLPLYEEMSSPIANKGTFFQLENFDGEFDGAQGFRLPRDDLYNITVAGASGGEGVCNFHYGYGKVISAQVRLTTDYEYLIMVGHRGTSVCDVPENANHPICQLPRPTKLIEAQNCTNVWFNWTAMFDNSQNRYRFNGGGGGGGASMIWPRRADNKEFTDLPIVISPGGGGASAILDYEFVAEVAARPVYNFTYPMSASNEGIYTFHTNAHIIRYSLAWPEGVRGFRTLEVTSGIISGAGGGWGSLVNFPLLSVDGKLLSQERSFAEGGFDCSMSLEEIGADVFTDVFGGYGGGGGGCGSGGGGGGYTGGHVVGNVNSLPGGGGDAGVFNFTDHELHLINMPNQRIFNDGNGYVEIVASNCGCDGECVVYTEERQFECQCPNNTLLAEDESSCYQEINVTVIQVGPLSFTDNGEAFSINGLQFENSSLLIFGLDVSLTVSPIPGSGLSLEEVACAVVFVGQNSRIVLASNPVKVGTRTASQLTILGPAGNDSNSFGPASDYVRFLGSPILVTGAFLLTNGECSLASPLRVNISSEDETAPVENFGVFVEFAQNSSRLILDDEDEITTTMETRPPTPAGNVGLIIGLVILGCILVVVLVGIVAVLLFIRFSWTKKRSRSLGTAGESRSQLVIQTSPQHELGGSSFGAPYEAVKNSNGAIEIDKVTGNEYALVNVKGGASINPYATLTSDGQAYETPISLSGDTFTPRYGIIAPKIDFTMYNRKRTDSAVNDWDYPRNNLVYLRELGEGQFGKVLLMKAKNIAGYDGKIPVAVKTLTSRDPDVIEKFMEEADLMKKFTHPNIVSLLGICLADTDGEIDEDSAPLMILEYMPYGDLETFLSSHQPNETGQTSINQKHFLNFSIDIARALEFLAMNKYVHRDIAARNCLVGPDLHIKIGDFGLSRGVYDKDYYKIAGKAVLPVRWLAPESLIYGIFSTASDVWSYGVTIWEITSYGATPLEDFEVQEVVDAAQKGSLQHTRPVHCTDLLYEVMCRCHQHKAKDRPSFGDILTTLLEENKDIDKEAETQSN